MTANASCLIKTRFVKSGFPSRFLYYPENMDRTLLEELHELVLESMSSPDDITSSDKVRKIVICKGGYLICGISGYLCDVLKQLTEEYDNFTDKTNTRRVYGFFALVWKISVGSFPVAFPDTLLFETLIQKKILPFWELSENSPQMDNLKKGIPVPFDIPINTDVSQVASVPSGLNFNNDSTKTLVIHTRNTSEVVNAALTCAASGQSFSLCSGFFAEDADGTAFDNLIVDDCENKLQMVTKTSVDKDSRAVQELASERMNNARINTDENDRSQKAPASPMTSELENALWCKIEFMLGNEMPSEEELDKFIKCLKKLSQARKICYGVKEEKSFLVFSSKILTVKLLVDAKTDIRTMMNSIYNEIVTQKYNGYFLWIYKIITVKIERDVVSDDPKPQRKSLDRKTGNQKVAKKSRRSEIKARIIGGSEENEDSADRMIEKLRKEYESRGISCNGSDSLPNTTDDDPFGF